jgi:lipid-binding SYLF domain-containing protein
MMALAGGSFGLQIWSPDRRGNTRRFLVMNERGASGIRISKVKLGADASVAAGPVGRSASAETDATVRARRHPSSSSGDDFDTGFPDSKA